MADAKDMRIARVTESKVVHHVLCRFVDREWFFRDDEERDNYLRLLGRAIATSDWLCLAYALMSNHIHLVMLAGESTLDSWARRVNSPFARWMNDRHGRLGPMFAHRPRSPAIQPHDEGRVIAYVHNNPVQAGVVARARYSKWTSHAAYVGRVRAPSWLACAEGLSRAGFAGEPRHFDTWVNSNVGIHMPELELEPMARSAHRCGALELATPTIGEPSVVPLVRRPFGHVRANPLRLVTIVSEVLHVPVLELCSRQRRAADARRVAVHSGRSLGLSGADIAAALGISQQAVSKMALAPVAEPVRSVCAVVVERVVRELPIKLGA